jgi:hypothetical protein
MTAMSARWFLERGFAEPPRIEISQGGERLYRVYGRRGAALGQWFSRVRFDGVLAAERALNVVIGVDPLGQDYTKSPHVGNLCRFWASFDVKAGAVMHVGRVHHGKTDLADRSAIQVYIERPELWVTPVEIDRPLRQDVFVAPKAGHA